MGELATGKVLSDVEVGVSQALKAVITDRDNKVDSLDMTVVKAAGVDVSSDLVKLAAITSTAVELNKLDGGAVSNAELNLLVGLTETPVQVAEVTFAETAANATHTGTVTLPAGSTLLDIIITAVTDWNSGTSTTLIVGDATDPDGYFTAVDLQAAADLAEGESISLGFSGAVDGADADPGATDGDQVRRRYDASARDIVCVITDVNAAGTDGRTHMTVIFSLPTTPVAATVT